MTNCGFYILLYLIIYTNKTTRPKEIWTTNNNTYNQSNKANITAQNIRSSPVRFWKRVREEINETQLEFVSSLHNWGELYRMKILNALDYS